VADGATMRVATKGHVGRGGGPVGDLYITATVEPHRVFARDGDDLHLEAPISVNEAVLGATFEVPTIDGRATLTVPPGTSSGQRFCIRGEGALSPKTGDRGNLVVTVVLSLPKIKDERSRELLREFGRLNATNVRNGLFLE
jgi:DnaJ-class molecular chaperone